MQRIVLRCTLTAVLSLSLPIAAGAQIPRPTAPKLPPPRPGVSAALGACVTSSGNMPKDGICSYRQGLTAEFKGGTWLELENGLVKSGVLSHGQRVYFAGGKYTDFIEQTQFRDGYLQSGTISMDRTLEWAPGRSCTWRGGDKTFVTTFVAGYVQKGVLASPCTVPNVMGKDKQWVSKTFPAGQKLQCSAKDPAAPYCVAQ